jgi:hypothetical protein
MTDNITLRVEGILMDAGSTPISTRELASTIAAVAREVRAEALRNAAIELETNWGHIATPEMRDALLALIDTPPAPHHTDLMAPPETVDTFMDANPLPAESHVYDGDDGA